MTKQSSQKLIGVIGAGSFGTAVANLIAYNTNVLLYSRQSHLVETINSEHKHPDLGVEMAPKVAATSDLEEMAKRCTLIFPIVPSDSFRDMMRNLSPYLRPYHLLIHGTKGFDFHKLSEEDFKEKKVTRDHISTMSEVILQESVVVRVGCLSGPNLAKEIFDGQPTATVIGSKFKEVIEAGKRALNSKHFQVFGTYEILGAELAGALKNVIAIGSGILGGLGMGKNIQALLINRGLIEMIYFGKAMDTTPKAFVGTAGIGDLVCTATSEDSRNYTFGKRLGQGEKVKDIIDTMPELAEGIRTLKVAKHLAEYYGFHIPITQMLYRVVYEDFEVKKAIEFLMRYPYYEDVDFL